jgi:hypothetical protein
MTDNPGYRTNGQRRETVDRRTWWYYVATGHGGNFMTGIVLGYDPEDAMSELRAQHGPGFTFAVEPYRGRPSRDLENVAVSERRDMYRDRE